MMQPAAADVKADFRRRIDANLNLHSNDMDKAYPNPKRKRGAVRAGRMTCNQNPDRKEGAKLGHSCCRRGIRNLTRRFRSGF